MSKLIIDDLNFFEDNLRKSDIQGGGKYSASYSKDAQSAYSSGYTVKKGKSGYVIKAHVSGATAGAVAGAIAVGGKTYTYASAGAGAS